jgi:hypothetical protein
MRDEDTYIIGDAEEEEDAVGQDTPSAPPPYTDGLPQPAEQDQDESLAPSIYYIKRNDTLQGIALRFRLDVSLSA